MAFTVKFYQFSKPNNSTKRPATDAASTDYTCTVFESCGSLNPAFKFNIGNANPLPYNYCYVPHTGYYYFVQEWRWEPPFWIAECQEDVLASWRGYIGGMSAYVLRAAAAWDGAIVDNLYPADGDPVYIKNSIGNPWSAEGFNFNHGRYIVGTISKTGATNYASLTPTEFTQLATTVFSDAFFTDNIKAEAEYLTRAIFDPMQYLSSVMWFPFEGGGGGRAQDVYLGYWFTGIRGLDIPPVEDFTKTVTIPKHPQAASRGKYLNLSPHSGYVLDLRPFGRIALDPASLQDVDTLTLQIKVDWISGNGILTVLAGGIPIALQQAQVGVQVQLSQVLHNYAGGIMSTITSTAGSIASAATGNMPGAITGGVSAIGSALSTVFPTVTTQGINGGFASLEGEWSLTGKFYNMVPDDLDHRGRPLCQVRTLSTLPGYQLCVDVEVNIPATVGEREQIKAYLEGGYYYE